MTYDLVIGDKIFSSWSLRGWLLLKQSGADFRVQMVKLYFEDMEQNTMAQSMAPFAPARLVPTLKIPPEGTIISESLAIAETLAERHPEAGIWPANASARAVARWLCAEMASGFAVLRDQCPMQLYSVWEGFEPSQGVLDDLARLEALWTHARKISGAKSGWLFGERCAADAFFAPVAARIIGYDLPVSKAARDYCVALLSDKNFKQWRAEGLKDKYDTLHHDQKLPKRPWPEL